MENNDNRIDNIIENSLRDSLLSKPHIDFTKNLMLKISLEEEFARQDKKTETFFRKFVLSIAAFFVVAAGTISYILYNTPGADEPSQFSEKTTGLLESYSFKLFSTLGLNGGGSLLLILSIIVGITLFLTADKFILRKK